MHGNYSSEIPSINARDILSYATEMSDVCDTVKGYLKL